MMAGLCRPPPVTSTRAGGDRPGCGRCRVCRERRQRGRRIFRRQRFDHAPGRAQNPAGPTISAPGGRRNACASKVFSVGRMRRAGEADSLPSRSIGSPKWRMAEIVEQRVAGAGVAGQDLVLLADPGQVRYAANVQHGQRALQAGRPAPGGRAARRARPGRLRRHRHCGNPRLPAGRFHARANPRRRSARCGAHAGRCRIVWP